MDNDNGSICAWEVYGIWSKPEQIQAIYTMPGSMIETLFKRPKI